MHRWHTIMLHFKRIKIIFALILVTSFILMPLTSVAADPITAKDVLLNVGTMGVWGAYKAADNTITTAASDALSKTFDLSLSGLTKIVLTILTFLIQILGWVIQQISEGIKAVVSWKVYGGEPILVVWTTFRNICNMIFIVLMIVISFATIFKTLHPYKQWYAGSAIKGVIIAAILINFSLPIGQAVTGLGNFFTGVVVGMYPSLGDSLIETLKPAMTIAGGYMEAKNPQADTSLVTENNITKAELDRYIKCKTETASTTWDAVRNGALNTMSWFTNSPMTVSLRTKTGTECYAELNAARQAAALPTSTSPNATAGFMVLVSAVMNIILLFMVASSLFTVLIFLLIRIIAIWLLLAVSPLPFFGMAIPGGGKEWLSFSNWFRKIVAWNLFGPEYLFILGLGLLFLRGQGDAMNTIINQNGNAAFSIFQIIIFYIFATIVFIGGLAVTVKTGTASTVKGTEFVGGLANKLGVFDEKGLAPARWVGQKTGVSTYAQAAQEKLSQESKKAQTKIRGVLPTFMQSKEESLATARQRFGVKGGAEELAKMQKTKIDDARKLLEDPIKDKIKTLEANLSQATDPERRAEIEKEIKRVKAENVQNLRDLMEGSKDINVALAAGEALMEDDKLTPDEMRSMAAKYGALSPAAQLAFMDRRDKTLLKGAPKKKFKDEKEMQDYISLMSSSKQAGEYYKVLKKGKNKAIALEAGGRLSLEKKPDGTAYTATELLDREASNFSAEDWVATEEFMAQRAERARKDDPGRTELDEMEAISEDFRDAYLQKFLGAKSKSQMFRSAGKNDTQLKRLREAMKKARDNEGRLAEKKKREKMWDESESKEDSGKEDKKEEKKDEEKKEDKK